MTGRVTAQLARTTGTATCSRCLDVVAIHAGHWHAADADETHRAVCDRCTKAHDPHGHAALLAWRRAANSPATGSRNRS